MELDPVVAERLVRGRDVPAEQTRRVFRELGRLREQVQETLRDVDTRADLEALNAACGASWQRVRAR